MDFLQFLNHIQKKITGKNRVHGIGQGHDNSNNTGDINLQLKKEVSATLTSAANFLDISSYLNAVDKDVLDSTKVPHYDKRETNPYRVNTVSSEINFTPSLWDVNNTNPNPIGYIDLRLFEAFAGGLQATFVDFDFIVSMGTSTFDSIRSIKLENLSSGFKVNDTKAVPSSISGVDVYNLETGALLYSKYNNKSINELGTSGLELNFEEPLILKKLKVIVSGDFTVQDINNLGGNPGWYTPGFNEQDTLKIKFYTDVLASLEYTDSNQKKGVKLKFHKKRYSGSSEILEPLTLNQNSSVKVVLDKITNPVEEGYVDPNQSAQLGYFNADLLDGLHLRTSNSLNRAYIPVADQLANPNLYAEALNYSVYTNQGVLQNQHILYIDPDQPGSLLRKTDNTEYWRIESHPFKDSLPVGYLPTNIEPAQEINSAVFFGSALGIRGWGLDDSSDSAINSVERGFFYLGAIQSGGIGVWSSTTWWGQDPAASGSGLASAIPYGPGNPNGYAGRIINPDGTLNGNQIKKNSIPADRISGLSATAINGYTIPDKGVELKHLDDSLQGTITKVNSLKWFSVVVTTSAIANSSYSIDLPNDVIVLSILFVGGSSGAAGVYWTPGRTESSGSKVLETSGNGIVIQSSLIEESKDLRITVIYTSDPAGDTAGVSFIAS